MAGRHAAMPRVIVKWSGHRGCWYARCPDGCKPPFTGEKRGQVEEDVKDHLVAHHNYTR